MKKSILLLSLLCMSMLPPVADAGWGKALVGGERLYITKYYKSEKDMMAEEAHPARRDFIRIERSKRLVKG